MNDPKIPITLLWLRTIFKSFYKVQPRNYYNLSSPHPDSMVIDDISIAPMVL